MLLIIIVERIFIIYYYLWVNMKVTDHLKVILLKKNSSVPFKVRSNVDLMSGYKPSLISL